MLQSASINGSGSMPAVGNTVWRLPEILETYDITAYRLAVEMSGGKVGGMSTVYKLADKDKRPKQIGMPTITRLLDALRTLTGEDIQLTDLIEYTPDK